MAPSWLNDLVQLGRMTRDFPGFLRSPITVEQAVDIIKGRLATREERFLRILEQMIYGHPQSPYLLLLRAAGAECGDVKAMVAKEGVEGALTNLSGAGVYITFDEFKGRKEAIRGSQRFAFAEDDFDNPRASPHFEARSGGTRGAGTSVKMGLPSIADKAVDTAVALHVHALSQSEHAVWLGIGGLQLVLLYLKLGRAPLAWFYPVKPLPFKTRAGTRYLAMLGRLLGSPLPTPMFADLQNPGGIALWLADRLKEHKSVCVTTYASGAVRISAAAREGGLDLTGACFITLGEPYTEAKQRIVGATGARALVRYAFTEGGIIGYGCGTPHLTDDLHLFSDSYGLIQRPREVGTAGPVVDAFLVTTLLSSAPKILLNVESGDYGIVERRSCHCGLGTVGLTTHVARIRSFEKLSSEGVTFVQTDLLQVLEGVLPARFGGTSADYQVVEVEENGILRVVLLVSPRVGQVDEEQVRQTFLEGLGRVGWEVRLGAANWRRAGTVEVRRQWPIATKAGKILPFHLVKS